MLPSFSEYQDQALAQGFDEVVERVWPANKVVDTHTHAFSVKAIMISGEMWLTVGESTQHLLPGDSFTLESGQPHVERYGSSGATYWAARRN